MDYARALRSSAKRNWALGTRLARTSIINMRNATCAATKTSKVPAAQAAFLLVTEEKIFRGAFEALKAHLFKMSKIVMLTSLQTTFGLSG